MTSDKEISLFAVGDIMLGDSPYCYGFGVGSLIEKFGSNFPFEYCVEELGKADILFGNLEAAISGFHRTKEGFEATLFRGQPKAAQGLAEANFDVVSLSNNHIMQHGKRSFEETLDVLSLHDIRFTGVNIPQRKISNCCIIEKNEFRICFLGYNFRPQQYFLDPPLYVEGDFTRIRNEIEEMKNKADIIIVSVHWGDEFISYPSPEQINLAHQIIDCGANIILGHHPHIIQGVERYKGGVIAYSLGNFVFDMWQERFRKTMILKLLISETGCIYYEIVPVMINTQFQPQILEGKDGQLLVRHINALSGKIYSQPDRINYDNNLRSIQRKNRREIYWHYLTHMHKYNTKHLFLNFVGAMKRRLR